MPIKPQTARRFDRSSPVARYWLAHCEGFHVRGPLKGTVEQVVAAPDLQTAQALVVRTRGRKRNVPIEAVDVVVPASREIVVDAEQVEPTAAPARAHSRALAKSWSRAVTAAAATTARVTPRAARSLADVLKTVALLVAVGVAGVARVLFAALAQTAHASALAGARVRADLHARQLAADRRRYASRRPGRSD
ncbi:MAG TPA: hypothetical protein VLB89_00355 [Gaiellaceae bacterium]|nr:hypothetical protein [Gaiellaceae bacterium]